MSTDYIVASLPALAFDAPAPLTWEKFRDHIGRDRAPRDPQPAREQPGEASHPKAARELEWLTKPFSDLETQLRNAVAEARGGAAFRRPATGCALYWKNRVLACFQEKDVLKRDELLDRVWWDAAGELTPPSDPLGKGALATYAIRLRIALKRTKILKDAGNAAFDRLTCASRSTTDSPASPAPRLASSGTDCETAAK